MAKVTLHPPFKGLRGRLGGLVFRLYPNGKTIVSKYPDMSKVIWSPAQEEHRQRFKRAIAYAKAAISDPDVRAVYEKRAAEKDNRPFQMAVSDYFKGIDLLSGEKRAEQAASPPCDVLNPPATKIRTFGSKTVSLHVGHVLNVTYSTILP